MCVNCVVSVTTFALPVLVGGAGVLQARLKRSATIPEPTTAPVEPEELSAATSGRATDS